jgi:hypothetical protein
MVQRAPRWRAARVVDVAGAASRGVASTASMTCGVGGVSPARGVDGTSKVGAAIIVGSNEQRDRTGVTAFRPTSATDGWPSPAAVLRVDTVIYNRMLSEVDLIRFDPDEDNVGVRFRDAQRLHKRHRADMVGGERDLGDRTLDLLRNREGRLLRQRRRPKLSQFTSTLLIHTLYRTVVIPVAARRCSNYIALLHTELYLFP